MATTPPLHGMRIIECSALGPAQITTPLVDLGAEVIKVEPPAGDYIREMTWPIVEGTSLMHLHLNRGKRSLVLDLRTEAGVAILKELATTADAVVEAMRPGALARRGAGFDDLRAVNPKIVFCTISGYGMTGPYRDYPSHGVAYDTWAGIVNVATDDEGFTYIPEHASIGIHAGPLFGALGILAAVLRARATGEGSYIDIAQSDAAAAMDWLRSETWRAYERPESEVTGNKADGYERRAPGTAGMVEASAIRSTRRPTSATSSSWRRSRPSGRTSARASDAWISSSAGRARSTPTTPAATASSRASCATSSTPRRPQEWLDFGGRVNTPIAPVNTPKTLLDDPQFADRFPLLPAEEMGADQLFTPLHFVGESLPHPSRAPTVGQHTEDVLRSVLGYDDNQIASARDGGAFGADA